MKIKITSCNIDNLFYLYADGEKIEEARTKKELINKILLPGITKHIDSLKNDDLIIMIDAVKTDLKIYKEEENKEMILKRLVEFIYLKDRLKIK